MLLMLISCTQNFDIIWFTCAFRAPPAAGKHYCTSLLTLSFSISFEVTCFPLTLWSTSGLESEQFLSLYDPLTPFTFQRAMQIAACLSHQFIYLFRLGSCYFIPEIPCPKMPEILLPFHSLNQNWKLLSHRALICHLAAACWGILLWIIWKASLGLDPQRGWEAPLSMNFAGGVKRLCRVKPSAWCRQRRPVLEVVAGFPLTWRGAELNCSIVFSFKNKGHLWSGCFKKHIY